MDLLLPFFKVLKLNQFINNTNCKFKYQFTFNHLKNMNLINFSKI